jgi:hypothetical protein
MRICWYWKSQKYFIEIQPKFTEKIAWKRNSGGRTHMDGPFATFFYGFGINSIVFFFSDNSYMTPYFFGIADIRTGTDSQAGRRTGGQPTTIALL